MGCFHVWQFPEGSEICLCFAPSELMGFKSGAYICLGLETADRLKSLEKTEMEAASEALRALSWALRPTVAN